MKEFVKKLREKADVFEKSGCSVDGIVKDYRKSADMIEGLCEKSNISGFVERLIEKLDMEITDTYYKSVEGSAGAGIENNTYHNIKKFIMQLAEEFATDINVGSKNQGWILCSERLPEEANDYFVTQYNENAIDEYCDGYRTSTIFFNGVWWNDIDCEFGWKIIAWHTLPNPYKPEEYLASTTQELRNREPQTNFYSERFNRVI